MEHQDLAPRRHVEVLRANYRNAAEVTDVANRLLKLKLVRLEQGEAAPALRWLLAGLACGVLWETCNYWARVKWVYTVPGFESLKVFEMPLAGFL